MRPALSGMAASLLLILAACASNPEIDEREFERADTAVRQAREADDGRYAAALVARAEERLEQARREADAGNGEAALRKIDEAAVLAELAEATSLAEQSSVALAQVRESLTVLRERIN
jgi:hypothetical protein